MFVPIVISGFTVSWLVSGVWSVLFIIGISALLAAFFSHLILLARNRYIRYGLTAVIALLFWALMIVDVVLKVKFGLFIGQDAMDILSETNSREAAEFIHTYFPWYFWLLLIIIIGVGGGHGIFVRKMVVKI